MVCYHCIVSNSGGETAILVFSDKGAEKIREVLTDEFVEGVNIEIKYISENSHAYWSDILKFDKVQVI